MDVQVFTTRPETTRTTARFTKGVSLAWSVYVVRDDGIYSECAWFDSKDEALAFIADNTALTEPVIVHVDIPARPY